MFTLALKAMLLGYTRKSGGPPLFEPSFKVQRENAHNQSSGFTAAPGLEGLNARGPLKVHPKWRLELSGQPCGCPVRQRLLFAGAGGGSEEAGEDCR